MQLFKNITKCLIYIINIFWSSFCNQPLICTTYFQIDLASYFFFFLTNIYTRILITQITLESKGRFLANNILFGLACLVIAQVQFFFTKNKNNNKDSTSRTLAPTSPQPYVQLHLIFGLATNTPPPPKVDIICVSPLTKLLHLSEFSLDIVSRVKYVKFQ